MHEPRSHRPLRVAVVPIAAALVLLPSTVVAQEQILALGTFALDRYEPTPTGDCFFAVPTGAVDGEAVLRMGLTFDYAKDPLVLRDTCEDVNGDGAIDGAAECNVEDGGSDIGSVVAHQFVAHVGASFSLWEHLAISLSVPMVLVNSGDNPTNPRDGATQVASPDGASVGDLRFGLRVQLLGKPRGPAELAVGSYLWFPTGDPDEYTGDDGVRAMPHATLSGKLGSLAYGTQIGVMIREPAELANVRLGTELTYGLGAGLLLAGNRVQIGPELYGSTVVANDTEAFQGRTTHVELLGGASFRAGDFVLGAAAGPGLTHGIGSPALRALATIQFAPDQLRDGDGDGIYDSDDACPKVKGAPSRDPSRHGCPPDKDGDGILDEEDACPDERGVADPDPQKNGCPLLADRDGDGIPDARDACPDVKGSAHEDPKRNGCPPDRDGDAIADDQDACPDVPGVASPDPKKNGCPPDRDGDGVPDDKDACPDVPGVIHEDPALNGCPGDTDGDTIRDDKDACPREKGPADPDPQKNGCPTLVRVTKGAIKILQQVQFAFGSAKILPASDVLLGQVAAVLKEHPEIKKVRVEGHTDDRGPDAVNKKLSDDRAKSVMKWLTDNGVDAGRVEAAGFGEEKPIGDNKTEDGRQTNRRVEFNIVDPAPSPEDAPQPALPTPGQAVPTPAPGPPAPKKP